MVNSVRKNTQLGVREKLSVSLFLLRIESFVCVCYRFIPCITELREKRRDIWRNSNALFREWSHVHCRLGVLMWVLLRFPARLVRYRFVFLQLDLSFDRAGDLLYLVLSFQRCLFYNKVYHSFAVSISASTVLSMFFTFRDRHMFYCQCRCLLVRRILDQTYPGAR